MLGVSDGDEYIAYLCYDQGIQLSKKDEETVNFVLDGIKTTPRGEKKLLKWLKEHGYFPSEMATSRYADLGFMNDNHDVRRTVNLKLLEQEAIRSWDEYWALVDPILAEARAAKEGPQFEQ